MEDCLKIEKNTYSESQKTLQPRPQASMFESERVQTQFLINNNFIFLFLMTIVHRCESL